MARRKLDPEKKLSCTLTLKLAPPDYLAWRLKVDASGRSASEFFREAVLHNQSVVKELRTTSPALVTSLHLYARLERQVETVIDRALEKGSRAGSTGLEYLALANELSAVLEVFREAIPC